MFLPETAGQPSTSGPAWAPSGQVGDVVAHRYELRSVAGTGGMGAVWRARDWLQDRDVALKEFADAPAEFGAPAEVRAMREAQAAALVDHPSVVQVVDVAIADDRPWMVMELVEGHTLAEEIRQAGRLEVPSTVAVARQLLSALTAVHRAGLVHRDVKPSNVLIGDDGQVTLTDFGLAAPAGEVPAEDAGKVLGSPPYMAPEVLSTGECGAPGDLFSFGATLYTALEGERPFQGEDTVSTVRALMSAPAPRMPHAGRLEPLITGLLAKDPARRPSARKAEAHLAQAARA